MGDPGAGHGLWRGMEEVEERSGWKGRRLSPVCWSVETLSVLSLTLYSVTSGGGYSMATYSLLHIVTDRTVSIPGAGHDSPSLSLHMHRYLIHLLQPGILEVEMTRRPAGPWLSPGWKETYRCS